VKSLSGKGSVSGGSDSALPQPVVVDDELLSTLGLRFLAYKRPLLSPGSWTSVDSKIRIFLGVLAEYHSPELKVSALTSGMIRDYRDVLLKLPAHRAGFPEGVSIGEMVKMGLKPISAKTAKDSAVLIKEFLTWIEQENYPIIPGFQSIFTAVKGPRRQDQQTRVPYSTDQLKQLFYSEHYTKGKVSRAADYWLPLLALFTGARLAELAQLHLGDIQNVEGVWVLDLNEADDKRLKSGSSSRQVPIHSRLIELGFLEFVDGMKKVKLSARLFPLEMRTAEGKFDAYGKRFNRLRREVGIEGDEKTRIDFHSFRHTVRTKLAP
jgi:integrase